MSTHKHLLPPVCAVLLTSLLAGCAHAPLENSGALSSYEGMTAAPGFMPQVFTHSIEKADKIALKQVRTISIIPITLSLRASRAGLSREHQQLVANAASRALCNELSRQFRIVPAGQPADLSVRGVITKVMTTDPGVSAISQVGNVAAGVLLPVPIPVKRLPFGLGALTIEAEALGPDRKQVAGIIWESDANPFTSKARISSAGDAYDLATSFGSEFAQILRQNRFEPNPEAILAAIPSPDEVAGNVAYALGGKARAPACAVFGDGPGLIGAIASGVGAPPEWSDEGPR